MTFDLSTTPLVTLEDGVLVLPISRNAPGNPLHSEALRQSDAALGALLAGELDAGAVLLVGPGKNFCAGGDVAEFAAAPVRSALVAEVAELLHGFVRRLDTCGVPVVAAVAGWAAGAGLSLALAADVSVCGPSTRVLAAYPGIGYSPDGGMSWRLPRAIGWSRARAFLLTNDPVTGEDAFRMGMLTTWAADDDVSAAARALAARLAAGPRAALSASKALLGASGDRTLSEQLDAERDSISAMAAHPDGVEGVDAFVGKRSPRFGA